jgi:hypothetical protein
MIVKIFEHKNFVKREEILLTNELGMRYDKIDKEELF